MIGAPRYQPVAEGGLGPSVHLAADLGFVLAGVSGFQAAGDTALDGMRTATPTGTLVVV
jgi:hypothetical protein